MSSWTIYWILQLDSIGAAFSFACTSMGIIWAALQLGCLAHAGEDHWSWNQQKLEGRKAAREKIRRSVRYLPYAFASLLAINSLVPSTKTAAAMVVIPAIVNNESLKNDAGELYQLAKQALKNAVAGDDKEEKKP